jgi:glucosamine--fructose-6-phosphate aminotransferase (isomerizing)
MCGIVGYVGKRDCGVLLLEGLRRLEYRGYDSAGLALLHEGALQLRRAEGKLRNLEAAFYREPVPGVIGVGHTRWATHGRPNERNAHPHRADHVVVVHNGIIENHLALRQELTGRGRVFASETDTEIVAHLIAEAYEQVSGGGHRLHAAVRAALSRLQGAYALCVLSERHPEALVVARNASPLVLGRGQGEQYVASDIPALLEHTRDFIFLDDGDTAVLYEDRAEIFDGANQRVERAVKRISWDPVSAEKQGYKHFMLKEIHEQPARVVDTLRGRLVPEASDVLLDGINFPEGFPQTLNHVQIVACGTSYHSGLVGRYLLEELARVHTSVDLASEFRYARPIVDQHTLTIAISQSGETADTLAALREARRLGSRAMAICNVMESTIARESDGALYTHAGPEIGVASTKAFTTQLAALFLTAVWLGRRRGALSAERAGKLLDEIRQLPRHFDSLLAQEEVYHQIARDFSAARSFLFLGRGINWPIALEGALKLKEISYIHAEGYAFGEMKHGPIALIDEEMPIVAITTRDANYEKSFSNLEEVKARGGRVIAVATEGDQHIKDYADVVLYVPEVDQLLQPLINVVPLQLLAYYIADFKGTDVDQPRNLAKSVTVE